MTVDKRAVNQRDVLDMGIANCSKKNRKTDMLWMGCTPVTKIYQSLFNYGEVSTCVFVYTINQVIAPPRNSSNNAEPLYSSGIGSRPVITIIKVHTPAISNFNDHSLNVSWIVFVILSIGVSVVVDDIVSDIELRNIDTGSSFYDNHLLKYEMIEYSDNRLIVRQNTIIQEFEKPLFFYTSFQICISFTLMTISNDLIPSPSRRNCKVKGGE